MGARILFRDSQGRDGAIDLDPSSPVYVGRALDCAIRTDDAMVSRKHSMIRLERDRFFVEDLGSSNGTHVNDVRVTKQSLNHNDVVRCGSLWLRYIEDGPIQPAVQASPPPSPPPSPPVHQFQAMGAAPPADGAAVGPRPVGKRASQQRYGEAPGGREISPATLPPSSAGAVSGVTGNSARGPVEPEAESSVVVDLDNALGGKSAEIERLRAQLTRAQADFDDLQGRYDREAAEGKRVRAEAITLRDRIEELRRAAQDREDIIASHARVSEELREELKQTRDELANVRAELADAGEDVAARERQLERAKGDVRRLKEELEDLTRQVAEVSRTKDDGWKKLNDQLGELEHLREVINEQERMLEERRVGLVSQEAVIKELRGDKERLIREAAAIRAERDELRTDSGRQAAQIAAIDEENRRLSELFAQLQSQAATGTLGAENTVDLAGELKLARIEVRKLESDRERLQGMYDRSEEQVRRLEERIAEVEVELREAEERREVAARTRTLAEEAMAKAEARAHRADEEAIAASRARDAAVSSAEDARRELDRLRRHVDRSATEGPSEADLRDLEDALTTAREELRKAIDRANDAERQLRALTAERDAAQATVHGYKTGAFVLDLDDTADREVGDTDTDQGSPVEANLAAVAEARALAERALDVYDAINDLLSELRNNIMVVDGEFRDLAGALGGQSETSVRIITEALEALTGNAEEAKGALRGLKELVEFGT